MRLVSFKKKIGTQRKESGAATFKLGNGQRISFWSDSWEGEVSFNFLFPKLFRIALCPNGLVADHWEFDSNSWSVNFHILLKGEEITKFQELLGLIAIKRV